MIRVVAAIICKSGRYLIARRPPKSVFEGLWEFPGGKVEPDESDQDALIRELGEELGILITVKDLFMSIDHDYPDFSIQLKVYLAEIAAGKVVPSEGQEYAWADADEIEGLTFVEADQPIVERLIQEANQ